MALTKKQKVFLDHYLVCWNAAEAARRAGYSAASARSIGSENLTKPDIADAIRAHMQDLHMTADEVLMRLAEQSRGDVGEFLGLPVKNLRQHPRSHLLRSVKQKVSTVYFGKDAEGNDLKEVTETVEFEMYDSQAATVQIGRHLKLFTDRIETIDWRKEMEAAGLNPDAERDRLIREYEESLTGGAGGDAAGRLADGEGAARGGEAD